MNTHVDNALSKIKNNRFLSILIIFGIFIIALGSVSGALNNIFSFTKTVLNNADKKPSISNISQNTITTKNLEIDSSDVESKTDITYLPENLSNEQVDNMASQRINHLLSEASKDIDNMRLTTPHGNNAFEKYTESK